MGKSGEPSARFYPIHHLEPKRNKVSKLIASVIECDGGDNGIVVAVGIVYL